jgi:periplasmic divalent cation tolerance protein
MSCIVAYSTVGSKAEAETIATTLVEERIIACANIVAPVTSIYRWKGKVCRTAEWLLIMKTDARAITHLKARLPQLHPYDCPELVILPPTDTTPPYAKWITDSVK